MDASTTALLALMSLLGLNYALRVDALRAIPGLLWGITLLDLSAGTLVLSVGMPGFQHVAPVRYILGLMCFMHVAENMRLVSRDRAKRHAASAVERDARANDMLAALRNAGDEEAAAELDEDEASRD